MNLELFMTLNVKNEKAKKKKNQYFSWLTSQPLRLSKDNQVKRKIQK